MPTSPTPADLTEEQRDARRTRARDLIEERLTDTWPAWRRPGRKPNLPLAADIALDALGDLAAEILVDGTMMRALTIRDGVATLELAEATEMVRIFAAGMRGALDGATNYVEMEMTDGSTGEGFTVTVRRRERPTPHELRQQAEARVERLTAELAVARQLLGTNVAEGAADDAAAALGDGAVRCPLCPSPLMLHTPSGARAHFAHVHPEQQISGHQGPWPVLADAAPPAPADRAVLPNVRPHTLTAIACHLDARSVAILRPESETYAEWQAVSAFLRALAADAAAGVQPPTSEARCSYRLEHRRPGETTWQRNTPGIGANWSWQSREKAAQRLAEARDRWPDFEHRLIETTTTVTEQPAAPAAPEEQR
ncbi:MULTISPECIES: hypothetical protein [Streptomyces]|uniref:hypothetical protein n=1 Tax=Streptomyces TaxID=1883 RepID=UPI0004BD402D|nr:MULTISPECIES: hypothetical protein [Streptomyces]KOG78736.1 hypothetical protein ADK33_25825 [Streptomyces griseus subsp. rhodochrous]